MDNKLFLMNDGQANEMQVKKYDKEAYLQKIIKDNPNLLARSLDDGTFKKLYLVKQEYSIKELEYGHISYSLDHFMVDEEGIPVLVEVKRSTDTRIKREVVAQMLDYASRASKWDMEDIKKSFEENNGITEPNPDDGSDFWKTVSANLAAEHFRLVFAADEIPDTLSILIEFLDRTMKEIEVYGVELKPYVTENGDLLLASNIIGNSTLDSSKAASSGKEAICFRSIEDFKEEFKKRGLGEYIPILSEIYDFGDNIKLSWVSGRGSKHPSYLAKIDNQTILRVTCRKSQGVEKAFLEIWTLEISSLFNGKMHKGDIRERLINFPDRDALEKKGLLWDADSTLTINLEVLNNQEILYYILDTVKKLVEDIRQDLNN